MMRVFLWREKRISIGADDKFGAGLAVAVGIVVAERIDLAVSLETILIIVAFVGGEDDEGENR